jgi:hypothetical protein
LAATAAILILEACGFSATRPFDGFDGEGSRVRGTYDVTGSVEASADQAGAARADFSGIRASVRERSSLQASVGADGSFALVGVPSGSFTLVFSRDGRSVGEIGFRNVRRNQEITIVVALIASGEVVLVQEVRDRVSFEDECPRSPGFWCQNQDGKNPNLSAEEFQEFAAAAAALLASVPELDTPAEIAAAVCDTSDQLLRQLAALALNLAAGTITRETALRDEPYPTVGAAFDAAVAAARSGVSGAERNRIKDVLDRINNNANHDACDDSEGDDDSDDDGDPDGDVPDSGQITICHIPPGNPAAKHTLRIGVSAWPGHRSHGDYQGACQ